MNLITLSDAMTVKCPVCGAVSGEECLAWDYKRDAPAQPMRQLVGAVHEERFARARKEKRP
jgi:hypothetical protein